MVVCFDTISHELLLRLVERRVGDVRVLRLIRAWLKAGVMEEGKVTHPDRGSPQGGVISPTLSNIFLHEVDGQWCRSDSVAHGKVRLVRYADDRVPRAQRPKGPVVCNCFIDGGGPLGTGLQEQVSNRLWRLRSKAVVVSAEGKGLGRTRPGDWQEEDCKGTTDDVSKA